MVLVRPLPRAVGSRCPVLVLVESGSCSMVFVMRTVASSLVVVLVDRTMSGCHMVGGRVVVFVAPLEVRHVVLGLNRLPDLSNTSEEKYGHNSPGLHS